MDFSFELVKIPKYFVLEYSYLEGSNILSDGEYYTDLCERFSLTKNICFAKRYKSISDCKRALKSKRLRRCLSYFDFDGFIIIPCYD